MMSRIVFALILILLGVGFILGNLGVLEFHTLVSTWWPMAIILLGLSQVYNFFTNRGPLHGAVLLLVVGVVLQLWRLNIITTSPWAVLWPSLLILAGLALILSRGGRFFSGSRSLETGSEEIEYTAMFSGIDQRLETKRFQGGRVAAIFGGMELDLRDCALDPEQVPVVLHVTALFGGIEIRVPADWHVVVNGLPLLGGWDNKTASARGKKTANSEQPGAGQLRVECFAMFGGFEIKN